MMPKFEEFMEAFSYNPETFNEEQFKAAIAAAHGEDIGLSTAAVAAKDAELTEAKARNTKLGADNWALLMKQGPPVDTVPGTQTTGIPAGETPTPKTVESFFTKQGKG